MSRNRAERKMFYNEVKETLEEGKVVRFVEEATLEKGSGNENIGKLGISKWIPIKIL